MKKVELKQTILEAGKAKHQSVIDDYRLQINDLKADRSTDLDGQQDDQQKSFNNEINERISILAEQLNFALEEMNVLNRIVVAEPLHREVTLGSVVVTDKRTFFVSVSIEDFEVAGRHYFGLSQHTPLYKEMAGKKKGDTFGINKTHYTIQDIF